MPGLSNENPPAAGGSSCHSDRSGPVTERIVPDPLAYYLQPMADLFGPPTQGSIAQRPPQPSLQILLQVRGRQARSLFHLDQEAKSLLSGFLLVRRFRPRWFCLFLGLPRGLGRRNHRVSSDGVELDSQGRDGHEVRKPI